MKYYVKQMASIALVGLLFLSAVNSAAAQKVQAADRTSMFFSGSGEQKKGSTKVKKVTLNKKNLTLTVGNSKKLSATLTHVKKQKIIWKSSNKKVATVKNGKVTEADRGEWIEAYYPSKGIVEVVYGQKYGSKITGYVKIPKKGKAYEAARTNKGYNHGSGSYNWNGNYYWNDKQVMESEFNSLLNKLVGKKKIKIEYRNLDGSDSYSWKWHENTLQNRKNMENLIKW